MLKLYHLNALIASKTSIFSYRRINKDRFHYSVLEDLFDDDLYFSNNLETICIQGEDQYISRCLGNIDKFAKFENIKKVKFKSMLMTTKELNHIIKSCRHSKSLHFHK